MNISKVIIKNYRSIQEIEIPIEKIAEKNCLIFLGKNETGKSSILRAISLLNPLAKIDYDNDCNKAAKKKDENIEITFELESEAIAFSKKSMEGLKFPKLIQDVVKIESLERKLSVSSSNLRRDFIFIYLIESDAYEQCIYNTTSKEISIIADVYNGSEVITQENVKTVIGNDFEILKKLTIETILEEIFFKVIDDKIPKCIYWEPSESYLINSTINLTEFSIDETISIPLSNIFKIAGIKDVTKRIALIKNDLEEKTQLKLELSKSITDYLNKVWPEHAINIFIEIENLDCTVMVEDKDDLLPKYKMDQRSDGFKQFLSILLNLSIERSISNISHKIILMDEPEVHLHPSGIRYLRDELLEMSKDNLVIISTHSIYMVDKLSLSRHYKVSKEKSLTSIKQINSNNPYEEEVIYEALGTSIFEHIQPNMLLFEGTIDRDIFDAFTEKFKTELKPLKIGSLSCDGVEKAPNYSKFMDGKFVRGFVVLDSDADGNRVKDLIKRENKSFTSKNTFVINDIYNTKMPATVEDLLPKDLIIQVINEEYGSLIELVSNVPVIKQLETKNKSFEKKIDLKNIKSKITHKVLNEVAELDKKIILKKYNIYFAFLEALHEKIKTD